MRRITGLLLLALFAATQSGAVGYLHRCGHRGGIPRRAYARASVLAPEQADSHDEARCQVCATLHMPVSAAGFAPPLIWLHFFVAFLSLFAPRPAVRRAVVWIEGRGPPSA